MTRLQQYIERYGESAGPKLYHALQSRAAYIGSSRRRGREIEALTGRSLRRSRTFRSATEAPQPAPEAVSATLFAAEPGAA